jgi:hypothetical protein
MINTMWIYNRIKDMDSAIAGSMNAHIHTLLLAKIVESTG